MLTGSHWCQKKHWPRECRRFKTAITMRDARTPAKPEREILLTLYTPRAGMLAGSIIAGLNDEGGGAFSLPPSRQLRCGRCADNQREA